MPTHDPQSIISGVRSPGADASARPGSTSSQVPIPLPGGQDRAPFFLESLNPSDDELRRSEARYRALVLATTQMIWTAGPDGEMTSWQPALSEFLGISDEQLRERGWLHAVSPEERDSTAQLWRRRLAEHVMFEAECRLRRHDGVYRDFFIRGVPVLEPSGAVREWVGACRDITDRKEADEMIRWQAFHDSLTGLPNRVLFLDRLRQALAIAGRKREQVAVLILDIDRFKDVNDTLGHAAGDALLQEVAERLRISLRAEDTLARMGGDEFTLMMPSLKDPQDAAHVAQKLLENLRRPLVIDGHELFVTASIGISVYPHDGDEDSTLLRHADQAMYRAKSQGRNGYQLFTETMNAEALGRLLLEHSLYKGLERKEFTLYYQPQIEMNTWSIGSVEALVRWQHPTLGLLLPGQFIPLAEEIGLIVPLGEWVMREACRQGALWREQGRNIRVAINLSARQFEQVGLVETVQSALLESGFPAEMLDLELTESTIIQNKDSAAETLATLKELGVRICIDDFGTGYSSLSYLRRFPLDVLKIDRSFVTGLAEDVRDQAVVRALIDLAHALDLVVVVEGVENVAQRNTLFDLGCDIMQGFLFSPALSVEDVDVFLDTIPSTRRH
ncbi:MAG: EAL domain-containing protein [Capsulimonas sp.]|uniref:putative bifunctional diguanylate cyclase/phosphodiesterase n=1 Tax=Capsulimonas sp. TaxID=2494211 RepID=UPI0032663C6F